MFQNRTFCGHCKTLVPEFKKAAKILKGIANVAAIDSTVHKSNLNKYAIKGFPTIKIFGANGKSNPIEYQGPRTAHGIVEAVKNEISKTLKSRAGKGGEKKEQKQKKSKSSSGGNDGKVIELTDSNFESLVLNSKDAWMVEFFAPWCGHCKNLEPAWKKAAKQMGGTVKFGALDATIHKSISDKFNIRGFPTIKFFAPGSSVKDGEDYHGGRSSNDLVAYAESKFATVAPPPELVEATSQQVVQETCANKQLCIFTVLPSIYDCQSKCRNDRIAMLNDLAEMFKTRPWGWLWMEAGAQPHVEDAFGLGESGYPVLTAMSPNKMKFATQIGAFSTNAIKEFLNSVNYGKARVYNIPEAKLENDSLKVLEIPPWDGKDKALPVMEDVDLSDVDLSLDDDDVSLKPKSEL
uniref:Thioredoxin domain-containing protein n=1 Tax=Caenorhabditis japonica TaxID=281687 RepID=A0A8R1DPK3_CAEJA